jgi:hypothetical protein
LGNPTTFSIQKAMFAIHPAPDERLSAGDEAAFRLAFQNPKVAKQRGE